MDIFRLRDSLSDTKHLAHLTCTCTSLSKLGCLDKANWNRRMDDGQKKSLMEAGCALPKNLTNLLPTMTVTIAHAIFVRVTNLNKQNIIGLSKTIILK